MCTTPQSNFEREYCKYYIGMPAYIAADIKHAIIMYIIEPPIKLLDWIDPTLLFWDYLSKNPAAIYYLEQHKDKINWYDLSTNPAAIRLIEANMDLVNMGRLSKNPAAGHIINLPEYKGVTCWLAKNPAATNYLNRIFSLSVNYEHNSTRFIDFKYCLSKNSAAVDFLQKYPQYIHWYGLSSNPAAIRILMDPANQQNICWRTLSKNPAAITLLEENPDNIYWEYLAENPAAIRLIEANLDKIDYANLCKNPAAIHLIKAHLLAGNQLRAIGWARLSKNPAIFEQDYEEVSRIYAKCRAIERAG